VGRRHAQRLTTRAEDWAPSVPRQMGHLQVLLPIARRDVSQMAIRVVSKIGLNHLICLTLVSCLKGSCDTLVPVALGAQCVSTSQCPGSSICSAGVCGGAGSTCDVTDSSSACAPNRESVTIPIRCPSCETDPRYSELCGQFLHSLWSGCAWRYVSPGFSMP
jgi:hypothetical protein